MLQDPPKPLPINFYSFEKEVVDTACKRQLNRAMGMLTKLQRLVVHYYFWDKFTLDEIGKMVYSSESAACISLKRAMARIKNRVQSAETKKNPARNDLYGQFYL